MSSDNLNKQNVLVTGATGFVGRSLCSQLLSGGCQVRGTLLASESPSALLPGIEPVVIEPLSVDTPWSHALKDIDTIIHLAARVHIMDETTAEPLLEFRKVNTEGTIKLAREAVKAGVKRMVFISTIKVNGEESVNPYTENSPAQPTDPYGVSKWEAEQGLRHIEAESDLEVVVIRPTLVYGPGVKANFLNMMKVVSKGFPLPFAAINNKRSMIYVGNLVDSLTTCASHPKAVGKTFLVSDNDVVSTPELVRRTAHAMQVNPCLFSTPISLIRLAGKLTGKSSTVNRLIGSLVVDCSEIKRELAWQPPYTMEQGLAETAEWFKEQV